MIIKYSSNSRNVILIIIYGTHMFLALWILAKVVYINHN